MNHALKTYCFIILLLLPLGVQAQEPTLVHYTIEDGLPSNTVYYVYRDSKGFLWFATDKGIARYNGISFKCFTTIDGMADNEVFDLQEDHEGRLWMGTFNGNLCYYQDGRFHTEENTPWLYLPVKSMIRNISRENDGSLSVELSDGSLLDIRNNKIKAIVFDGRKLNSSLNINLINKTNDHSYRLLDLSKNSLIETDASSNLIATRNFTKNKSYLSATTVSSDQHYLFHGNKLYSLNEDPVYSFSDFDTNINQQVLYVMPVNGSYFITTKMGLYLGNDFHLFRGQTINGLDKDINSNYWVATYNKGVYGFYKDYKHTRTYNQVYQSKVWDARLMNGEVFYVLEDGSLHKLVQGRDRCLFNPSAYFKNKPSSRANERGYFVHNSYWYIGNKSLCYLDDIRSPAPRRFTKADQRFFPPKKLFSAGQQTYLTYHTNIYANTLSGIFAQSGQLTRGSQYDHKRIYASAQDADQALWYATIDSMYKMARPGVQVYQPQFRNIAFKDFDFYGHYLIGFTHKNALYIINHYDCAGMQADVVKDQNCIWEKMYQIDDEHVLISTNNHYRLLTLRSSAAAPAYDIKTIENPYIPDHAEYVCGDSSHVYFFKDGNITSIYTSDLLKETPVPRILFSEIKTTNRTLPIHESISLSYKESREVSISFVPVSYYSKDLLYEYSISGKDGDDDEKWQPIKGEVITLIKPQFGHYKIKVRVKSVSSAFSAPAVIELAVLKPYWATGWFIILALLGLVAIIGVVIWLVYRRQLRIKSEEYNANIRYQKSEYKALNALMNPHFIFNSLNNIQGLINSNDKKAANDYLVIFSDLVRQNMHNITEGAITLYQELELVRNYLILEKLRFDELVNYTLSIDEEVDTEAIQIPPLLIQPLVENAIRHGLLPQQSPGSMLWLRVYEEDERVYIEISDNGFGIEQSRANKVQSAHRSYGLENLVKRIEHWNAINRQDVQFTIGNVEPDRGTIALIVIA